MIPPPLQQTTPDPAYLLIRLMVGVVFLSEGLQKFITPETVGAGRFTKIGLPEPEMLAALVGGFEILCGLCILLGFAVRLAAIPLLAIMAVAVWTTKMPILESQGFWAAAHASRNDFAMTLGSLFLLWRGAGGWSLDGRRKTAPKG